MSFLFPSPPDLTESLPASLPGGYSSAVTDPSKWDVTFGQLGFNLAASKETPYQRGTEQSRKQQIDTSESAGEQSLSSWWQRSQDSWHMGAGIRWYEPGAEYATTNRFASAQGIDPWTQGEVTLLHKTAVAAAAVADDVYVCGLNVGTVAGYAKTHGSAVAWVPETGSGTTGTLPASGATQPAAAGGVVWVGHTNGLSKFTASTGVVSTPYTCTGRARAWWVKARLIAAVGNKLYELTPGGTGVIETLHPTPLYAHPQDDWIWTDVSETAGSILAAGYSNNSSAVFRFTLTNDTSNQPILTGGSQVAPMPPGERITCMGAYLGAYLLLGTTAGVRVGFASEDGAVQYGPLTVELDSPAMDVTFRDRFAYVTVSGGLPDGSSGALRIDLSTEVLSSPDTTNGTGRFAWSWDVSTGAAGECLSLCLIGQRVVLASARTVFVESATDFVDSGWLDTGRIRFRTVEPKAFRLARLVSSLNGGQVSLLAVTPAGTEHRIVDFSPDYVTSSDVAIQVPGSLLHQFMSFRITLRPSDLGASPAVSGLVVKAVPAASHVRMYQYPLACFDFERGRYRTTGEKGSAYRRLSELEALEVNGTPVVVTDNRTGESYTGQIDTVDFSATSPPDRGESGFGGVAVVVVRRL